MVFLNVDLGSPSSPNSNPTAIPATSPKTVPNRTNSTNELPWNNNLEMPLASGIRARNESSLGKRTILSLFCPHIYGSYGPGRVKNVRNPVITKIRIFSLII